MQRQSSFETLYQQQDSRQPEVSMIPVERVVLFVNEVKLKFDKLLDDIPSDKRSEWKKNINEFLIDNSIIPIMKDSPHSSQDLEDPVTNLVCAPVDMDTEVQTLKAKQTKDKEDNISKIVNICLTSFENTSLPLPICQLPKHVNDFSSQVNSLLDNILALRQKENTVCFQLGFTLFNAKKYCRKNNLPFILFIHEKVVRLSLQQANSYIAFYKLCVDDQRFCYSTLSFSFIIRNISSINKARSIQIL
jgi:hypothetical protein